MDSANRGSLTEISFIEVLKNASSSNLTGMIRLEKGPVIKVVYLQNGTVAFASSNEKVDRLTEILKRAGRLTPEQVEDAQARLKPNVSLGKTLVELGYISARDLLWGARTQVESILHELVFWKEGIFQILEGSLPKEIIVLNLSVPGIIFDAICKTNDREWVLERIGSPEAVFRLAEDFHEKYVPHKLRMMRADDVVSRVNGKRSLQEIAHLAGIETFEVCKIGVALQYFSLLERMPEPVQMDLVDTAPAQDSVSNEAPPENAGVSEIEEPFAFTEADLNEPALATVSAMAGNGAVSLGQILEMPSVQDSNQPADSGDVFPAEPEPYEPERPEPHVVADVQGIAKTASDEPSTGAETLSELEPAIVTPVIIPVSREEPEAVSSTVLEGEPSIPGHSLQADEEEYSESVPQSRRWKPILIGFGLIALAAIVSGYFYYQKVNASRSPVKVENSVPSVAGSEAKQKQPVSSPAVEQPATNTTPSAQSATGEAPTTVTKLPPLPPLAAVPGPSKTAESHTNDAIEMIAKGQIPMAAEAWKRELNARPQGFIVQILIACQEKTVTDTLSLLEDKSHFRLMPIRYHGLPCYRVLFGPFSTSEEAMSARNSLPATLLQQPSPPQVMALRQIVK